MPQKWQVVVVMAALGLASALPMPPAPTNSWLDPDRNIGVVINCTGCEATKVTIHSSPATEAKTELVNFDKVKFIAEVVGGSVATLIVVISIICGVIHGESLEAALGRHFPIILRLLEVWRPRPRVQPDLIDL